MCPDVWVKKGRSDCPSRVKGDKFLVSQWKVASCFSLSALFENLPTFAPSSPTTRHFCFPHTHPTRAINVLLLLPLFNFQAPLSPPGQHPAIACVFSLPRGRISPRKEIFLLTKFRMAFHVLRRRKKDEGRRRIQDTRLVKNFEVDSCISRMMWNRKSSKKISNVPKDEKRANLKLTRRRMKDVFSSLFLEDCKRCSEKEIGIGEKSFILLLPPGRRCETMCPSPLKSAQVRRGRGEEGREGKKGERGKSSFP